MYNPHHTINFTSTQNITPIPTSLHNGTVTAEDLTALYNTDIPEELPIIDEEKAKNIEIDEDFTQTLSHSLTNLMKSIPAFNVPQFIPYKPLHDDINIQAEINKYIPQVTATPPPPPPPPPQQQPQPQSPPHPHPHPPIPTTSFSTNTKTINTNSSSLPAHHSPLIFYPQQTSTPPSSPPPPPSAPPPPHPHYPFPYYSPPQYSYTYCAYPYSSVTDNS